MSLLLVTETMKFLNRFFDAQSSPLRLRATACIHALGITSHNYYPQANLKTKNEIQFFMVSVPGWKRQRQYDLLDLDISLWRDLIFPIVA